MTSPSAPGAGGQRATNREGAAPAPVGSTRRDPALALLAVLAATPLVPAPWSLLVLAAAAAWLLWRRPPLREALAIGLGAAVALLLLSAAALLERRPALPQPAAQALAGERYAELWRELQSGVEAAAAAVNPIGLPPRDDAARLQIFHALDELSERRGQPGLTFLLFDPDGLVSAWAGEGLLHEPSPESLLPAGAQYIEGFGSATLLAVRPVRATAAPPAPAAAAAPAPRPWRLVAGRSLPTDALPFAPPGEIAAHSYRWSFLPAGAPLPAGTVRVAAPGAPTIGVALSGEPASSGTSERLRRAAAFALGLILLALGTMRAVGTAVRSRTVVRGAPQSGVVAAMVAGGALEWAWASGATAPALTALAVAALLATLLAQLPRRAATAVVAAPGGRSAATAFLLGVIAIAALAGLAHLFASVVGLHDLGSAFAGGVRAIVLRLAHATAAFGLLYGASRLAGGERPRESWAWASAGLLLLGAAFHDATAIAGFAAAAGGGALVGWLSGAQPLRRPLTAATALILSALAGALTWETVYRRDLRGELELATARLGPPVADETAALANAADDFLTALDLAALAPRDPYLLDRQDLAYRLWRDSPLARRNALSGLVVVGADGGRSVFSFGLPISSDGEPLGEAGAWEELVPAGWEAAAVAGEATLRAAGAPFGLVRYWLLPLPGFRLGGRETEDVRLALLRGGPARLGIEGLPAPAVLALYGRDGRIRAPGLGSPWPERPPLDPVLAAAGAARVVTPDGPAWGWTAPAAAGSDRGAPGGGRLALYLPVLGPRAALDRVGTHALGVVLLLFAGALLALLLGLPRAAFRDALRRALRSYSQRLILVYSLLLLLPLLIASALLVRRFESRSAAEQRAHGEQALLAAGRVLGEYLVTLPPGFGLGTAIDDRLLAWLAGVVRHDVSLYWGSGVYASSRRELFTAGLLPKRIPGEVSARLRLLGYGLAARTRRVADTAYLEVYSHLEVPGGGAPAGGGEDLALSVPLLAQQEEAAAELDSLRRQAILVTAGLFLLLVALGTRLARGFTQPLQELVHGTQRIAAGAAELGLRPAELELAALAEAIDRMAAKIAEGRERLVREKQVVERVVENITAGVVSLDARGRVLMANRVAAELMAPVVGEALAVALARRPRLAPLAAFVAEWSAETRQTTVRIPAGVRGERGERDEGGEGGEREWTAIWAPVPGAGEPAALLVVEDSTEVLRGQRLLAWAEMARIIAHEIKNPLTPIRLSAEHMREVYGRDPESFAPVFERCTTNILKQVEELRAIASEFSIYSHIPALQAQPGNLLEMVRAVVEAYAAAPPAGVIVRSAVPDGELAARFDPRLLGRALRNVLENAVRASAGGGGEVRVAVESTPETVSLVVTDQGPGVPAGDLARIFDPYFSTHAGGTGLGLPIARRIVEEHGGRVAARNRAGGGFEVTITIPR